jgi:hypothetical protein
MLLIIEPKGPTDSARHECCVCRREGRRRNDAGFEFLNNKKVIPQAEKVMSSSTATNSQPTKGRALSELYSDVDRETRFEKEM